MREGNGRGQVMVVVLMKDGVQDVSSVTGGRGDNKAVESRRNRYSTILLLTERGTGFT